jgi:hypothetical protein
MSGPTRPRRNPRRGPTPKLARTLDAGRAAPPRPPRGGTSDRSRVAIALVVVAVLGGAIIVGLLGGQAPAGDGPTATEPGDVGGPVDTAIPDESTTPVSPVLEARMPTSVDGSTLTVQSAVDATSLSGDPGSRALNAAVVNLGKQASDLEIAYAYDESGTLDLAILGFRVDGVAAADLQAAVLTAWLAADTPGVDRSTLTWSGTEVTVVSYGDEAADEYVVSLGDSVFVVETVDAAVAQSAVAALVGGGTATSPAPSAAEASSAGPSPAAS